MRYVDHTSRRGALRVRQAGRGRNHATVRAGGGTPWADPMSFALRAHTADVAVEATGETLAETFEAAAAGLSAAHCASIPEGGDRFSMSLLAESKDALLFDYLDELIYRRDVEGVLPTAHRVSIEDRENPVLEASARGVPLAAVDAREIKAVTYSEMELERTASGWRAYVVFDV